MNQRIFQDDCQDNCLKQIDKQICDSHLEEECEYNGELLREFAEGDVMSANTCQRSCEIRAPKCKYWIFHMNESKCILKRDGRKTCNGWGGPKQPSYDYCKNLSMP